MDLACACIAYHHNKRMHTLIVLAFVFRKMWPAAVQQRPLAACQCSVRSCKWSRVSDPENESKARMSKDDKICHNSEFRAQQPGMRHKGCMKERTLRYYVSLYPGLLLYRPSRMHQQGVWRVMAAMYV